eukprot:TRINITY_DN9833_c0_g1::TRINITY_DN9833_c0_g1_i1::g.2923::m.2923 TRINITY_DN9833_c0_g1::TRINITY_DN9833_c0_g1_i1::g.2923  ORF type:complete len:220 (-),score=24.56,sp/Q6GPM4/RM24_XENLA/34.59/6e-18,KOW/PF00467.24/5.4e+03,KOW/PF00467.24/0.15 TRINITY_DN9833_c0_g1_i1:41-661(-)
MFRLSAALCFRETLSLAARPPRHKLLERWHLYRNDIVEVVDPKNKCFGQRGKVLEIIRNQNRVVVQGINKKTVTLNTELNYNAVRVQKGKYPIRHVDQVIDSGHLTKFGPIDVEHVKLVDPATDKPTDVRFHWLEDGTRVRIAATSGTMVPPPAETVKAWEIPSVDDGVKVTSFEKASEKTYEPIHFVPGQQPAFPLDTPLHKRHI